MYRWLRTIYSHRVKVSVKLQVLVNYIIYKHQLSGQLYNLQASVKYVIKVQFTIIKLIG